MIAALFETSFFVVVLLCTWLKIESTAKRLCSISDVGLNGPCFPAPLVVPECVSPIAPESLKLHYSGVFGGIPREQERL